MPPIKLARFFRIALTDSNALVDKESPLHLTNPSNLFTSLKPAEHIQPPNLPSINFWPLIAWKFPAISEAATSTTAPPVIADSTAAPSLRIPVTTRKPGQDHHFADDDIVQFVARDGVHRLISNRQTFEYRQTARQPTAESAAAEIPAEPPKDNETHVIPPLIHCSDEQPNEIFSGSPDLTTLKLPQISVQPFYTIQPSEIISQIQSLPFEERNVRTFITADTAEWSL